MNAVTDLCFALVVVAGAAPCAAVSAQVGAVPRDSGPVFPATAIGGLGRGLIEAINPGDSAAQAALVAAPSPRKPSKPSRCVIVSPG